MTVTFDAPGLPTGFTATFSQTPLTFTGSGSTTMSVTAPAGSGGYRIVSARAASASGPSHTTGINLAVQDFTVTPTPATQTAGANDTVRFTFAIAGQGGFNSPVAITNGLVFTPNPTASDRYSCGTLGYSQRHPDADAPPT